jgi:hypothetical protein
MLSGFLHHSKLGKSPPPDPRRARMVQFRSNVLDYHALSCFPIHPYSGSPRTSHSNCSTNSKPLGVNLTGPRNKKGKSELPHNDEADHQAFRWRFRDAEVPIGFKDVLLLDIESMLGTPPKISPGFSVILCIGGVITGSDDLARVVFLPA